MSTEICLKGACLVVDDSAFARRVVTRCLRVAGFAGRVLEAANGLEAYEVMRGERVGLAVVDLVMPRMSGEEFLQKVKAHPILRRVPVVVVSSMVNEERRWALRDLGAYEVIHKPVKPPQLVQVFAEVAVYP